jgi:hypothetical protein
VARKDVSEHIDHITNDSSKIEAQPRKTAVKFLGYRCESGICCEWPDTCSLSILTFQICLGRCKDVGLSRN